MSFFPSFDILGSSGGLALARNELAVMIVEDDETAAEILHQFVLKVRPRARVEWFWSGFEALVKVPVFKPDLILLDYMMPKFDGSEFIDTLKKLETRGDSYIAVISAYVDKIGEKRFLDTGADVVLSKPVDIVQITELIQTVESRVAT